MLYHFDGPKMVLAIDRDGRQLLGVAADQDANETMRWVYAPAPPERVMALLSTRSGLRALFERGMLEVHDVTRSGNPAGSWTVAPGDVPEDLLPDGDAELPELSEANRDALVAEQGRHVERRSRAARVRMLFEGRPVRERRGIAATFAGEVLSSYQAIVALAYGHRRKGTLRSTGPIPERGGSNLMLADMPRGSVGFELVEDLDQERVVPTDLAGVVADVGALIDAAASTDAAYAEGVAEFDQRIVAALHGFLGILKKAEATMKLEAQGHEYVFDAARIADAVDRTASAPREEDDRPVAGTLIGFLPTDRRFELQVEGGVIKGRVVRDADLEAIASHFQKACTAHLHVVTVERLGQTAAAFTLLRVEAPSD